MKLFTYLTKHWYYAVIICFGILFSVFYLQSIFKWWYEDDPLQYARVLSIVNPFEIFTSQLLRTWSTGKSFVPMQILSYWIDVRLFGVSPRMAYIHSILSLIASMILICAVMAKLTQKKLASMLITVIWLLLPSTLVVHQFLATRHYMEGLLFGLAAIYLTLLFPSSSILRNNLLILFIGFFTLAAMLSKETYAAVIPTFIFICGLHKRQYRLVILMIIIAMLYAFYRIWTIGSGMDYTMPFLNLQEYLKFLLILPYTFSANFGGYLIYAAIFFISVILLWQKSIMVLQTTLMFITLLAVSLFAIYPVSYVVLAFYKIPGTWYRAPFLINTIVLLFGGYLVTVYLPIKWQVIGLLALLTILLPGTHTTRQLWNERMTRAELEGKFYLENPDKLLFSEEDAYWFIPGVKSLYKVTNEHHIDKQNITGEHAQAMIKQFPIIWRFTDGQFVEDNELYQYIRKENIP